MAAIVGEQCIAAAGEYKVREHSFVPGQRIFSDKINELLCGDNGATEINAIPSTSVFGILRDRLANGPFAGNFPELNSVFSGFASRIGKPEDWGKVPLSLPEEFHPRRLPLRVAFDTRPAVDQALKSVSSDKMRRLRISTIALAMLLNDERDQIDPKSALLLTLETVNGMGKTAPMKDEAIDKPTDEMKEAQHQVVKVGKKKN
ncbi:MAG: hypothetical protein HOP33_07200 [Verrucomicrobia bacterium]|nr:hypothetical protein [Verrucomicrobiota bacterium]